MTKNENKKAQAWREAHDLSIQQLADLTGYSHQSIRWFEKGETPPRTWPGSRQARKSGPIDAWVWLRFKMACAGVQAQLAALAAGTAKMFDW